MRNLLSSLFLALLINVIIYGTLSIPSSKRIKDGSHVRLRSIFNIVETELMSRGVVPIYTFLEFDSSMRGSGDVARAAVISPFLGYIRVEPFKFLQSTEEVNEALILHEYAHVLGYRRDKKVHYDLKAGFCPASVMHSFDDMEGCFYRFRNYYYSEVTKHLTKN